MGLISWLKSKFSKKSSQEEKLEQTSEESIETSKEFENLTDEEKKQALELKEALKEFEAEPKETSTNDKNKLSKKDREKKRKQELLDKLKEKREEKEKQKKEEKKQLLENKKIVDQKYITGLDKSHKGFASKLTKLSKEHKQKNAEYFDELERILIESDVGVKLTMEILDQVEKECNEKGITDTIEINDVLVDKMFIGYVNQGGTFKTDIEFKDVNPTVCLIVGVNGTGKTTTIAKLAKRYKDQGKKILLIAADTFRAGAIEQLKLWASRVGVDIFFKPENSDPASVCYEGLTKAKNEDYDLVLIDTAGRLHNKQYLMDELGKVQRVIKKVIQDAPHETLLVLDANTGQNGIEQAKVFKEVVPLTGVVITKMDGTSKGGIILAIRDLLEVPVRFIGLGEQMNDLKEFDLDMYLYGLLIGDENSDD